MYKIIKNYNICSDYSHQMELLYSDLRQFIKEKFVDGQIDFQPDERIIFDITDLDYFIDADFPGFALYNLQLILRELDIPNFACAVLSNIPNYGLYTKKIRDILRPDDVPLRAITISTELLSAKKLPKSIRSNVDNIEFPFISMSRLSRFHRTFFMSKLFESDLHTKGMVSYHNIDTSQDRTDKRESFLTTNRDSGSPVFLTTTPFTQYNSENLVVDPENMMLVDKFRSKVSSYNNFDDGSPIANKSKSMQYQSDSIQKSLVYIALETTAKYPTAFQSSISFKSIAQKRPFIIFGSPGCIKLLKDQGFRTFDQWWNESYDKEHNIEKRVDMIIEIVKYLASLDVASLRDLYKEMEPLLEYNYHHFTGAFITDQLSEKDRILSQSFVSYD